MASAKNYLRAGLAAWGIAAVAAGIAVGVTRSYYVQREHKLHNELTLQENRENERIRYCQEQGYMDCQSEDLACMQKTFHDPHIPTLGTYQRLDSFMYRIRGNYSGAWGFYADNLDLYVTNSADPLSTMGRKKLFELKEFADIADKLIRCYKQDHLCALEVQLGCGVVDTRHNMVPFY